MKKLIHFTLIFFVLQSLAVAQKSNSKSGTAPTYSIPLTPENWVYQEGKVAFVEYKGKKSMKLAPQSGQVVLKDVVFKDGTIEFDVEPVPTEFAQAIYFHRKDDQEQEIFYLRVGTMDNHLTNNAIQYTPYFDGINMWDMYPQYQAPALIKKDEWNHVKLVISGHQMRVYMNHQPRPVLEIPKLEGNLTEGSIAFEGASHIANVQVKANETESLCPQEGIDLTNHEANYLRKWAITSPSDLLLGQEVATATQARAETYLDSIAAERGGFVNLTRKFGGNKSRKVVWLKTKITAKEAIKTKLQLGFSDEVWVFLNNQMVFVDKNLFQQPPMRRYPEGRMSKDNASFPISLKEGDNELVLAVANDFYGWGVIARLESTEGITGLDEVSGILTMAKAIANLDLEQYTGIYSNATVDFQLTFFTKDKTLMAKAAGEEAFPMQAQGNHAFSIAQAGVSIEFKPAERKLVLKQGNEVKEFLRE